ncbi:hypothetical protein PS928_01916 [Pseudomonas fluorescens]|jgi:uncharacterized membrane-anchored protein|uniref:Uncharacterized protein n=1 Tax=Pseudomonas fluorescens TaxID=294 RepID=A0A5E7T595_PSEFL|nr:hypothetical protein BZ163_04430 [Pseudomonas sp. VI4.1]VVP93926.1 hypothetical protein PS928_01916 [Pseudomonas fluorescens]
MFWYGSKKDRFRVQRWISIIVLCVGALFLISGIYQYVSCQGPGYPIFKALVMMGVASVMFYIADKW